MLPKNRRTKRSIFSHILSNSIRHNSNYFTLYVSNIPNGNELSQFSFSVSKKVSKSAVDRNTKRRQGYSVINKNLNIIKNGFYCFFVYKKAPNIDYTLLEKDIMKLLYNSGVLI
jgi:ribonuclease P protein component